MIPFMLHSRSDKIMELDNKLVVAGVRKGGNGRGMGVALKGQHEGSPWEWKCSVLQCQGQCPVILY